MLPRFVICGLEHCGTTLLSELFRQVPGLDAGFEVGVLLARRPRDLPDFEPFHSEIMPGWGIDARQLAHCCDTDSFAEFYRRLAEAAALKPGTRAIFDKTPRYLTALAACMRRAPVPFIAIVKDPRALVYSDFRTSGARDFDSWFPLYAEDKIGYLREAYAEWMAARAAPSGPALPVRLEDLCLATRRTCEAIFGHAGFHFHPAYVALHDMRYPNARGASILAGAPFGYVHGLGAARARRVKQEFAEFSDWFYD